MGRLPLSVHPAQPHRAPSQALGLPSQETHHAGTFHSTPTPTIPNKTNLFKQGKFSNIPILEGFFHTAKSILARFHFVCNGSAPLQKLDWTASSVVAVAKLGPEQVRFMQATQVMIASKEPLVRRLRDRHRYEGTLYWAGQLFSDDFDRSPVCVVEDVDGEAEEGVGLVKSEG